MRKAIVLSITILILGTLVSPGIGADNRPGVTKANFERLEMNMSYAQVVEILGKPGELLSESEIGGVKTVMYQWKALRKDSTVPGANMNAMFQNDKLVSKAQFGLK